ncbi:hypothetical protein [Enterobacter phage 02_vB_Eclo_IJM]|nr:hypothetical protein [Enterobacter phage 02_vB_Eclo_IJM]
MAKVAAKVVGLVNPERHHSASSPEQGCYW